MISLKQASSGTTALCATRVSRHGKIATRKDVGKKSSVSREVREFRPPVVNFNAQDYVAITDWASTSITPQPVLSDFPDEQIESAVQNLGFVYDLPEYPCHTQSVEGTVNSSQKNLLPSGARNGGTALSGTRCVAKEHEEI